MIILVISADITNHNYESRHIDYQRPIHRCQSCSLMQIYKYFMAFQALLQQLYYDVFFPDLHIYNSKLFVLLKVKMINIRIYALIAAESILTE